MTDKPATEEAHANRGVPAFVGVYTLASVRAFRGLLWRAKHVDRAAAEVIAKNAELYRRLRAAAD